VGRAPGDAHPSPPNQPRRQREKVIASAEDRERIERHLERMPLERDALLLAMRQFGADFDRNAWQAAYEAFSAEEHNRVVQVTGNLRALVDNAVELARFAATLTGLRPAGRRRERWFANYTQDTLSRDLRDITDAFKLGEMPRLMRLLASQSAGELVYRNLASKLELTGETVKSYVRLLEAVFLVKTLPAWRPRIGVREVRAPKAYIVDSGLLAHLLGADEARIGNDDQVTGRLLESFVAMELLRLSEWAGTDVRLHHYRQGRDEIDLVMESRSGEIVAVEVKASATIRSRDYAAIVKLRDARGERFRAGVVVYTGAQTVPLGDRIWAMPVSGLWE